MSKAQRLFDEVSAALVDAEEFYATEANISSLYKNRKGKRILLPWLKYLSPSYKVTVLPYYGELIVGVEKRMHQAQIGNLLKVAKCLQAAHEVKRIWIKGSTLYAAIASSKVNAYYVKKFASDQSRLHLIDLEEEVSQNYVRRFYIEDMAYSI